MKALLLVLCAGGRDYRNRAVIRETLQFFVAAHDADGYEVVFVHGGAVGCDSMVDAVAKELGYHTMRVDALWGRYHKSAGPVRNSVMARLPLSAAILFPGGPGTADMERRVRGKQGITVVKP